MVELRDQSVAGLLNDFVIDSRTRTVLPGSWIAAVFLQAFKVGVASFVRSLFMRKGKKMSLFNDGK